MHFDSIFQHHAVLQRHISIPVWGRTVADETVTVNLGGLRAQTVAGADGNWLVRFPAQPAGGPFELSAESSSGQAVVRHILIGEVWVCAGQSNMEWPLSETEPLPKDGEMSLAQVRLLNVTNPARIGSQEKIQGDWNLGGSESRQGFSAVGCWFGSEIHKKLQVPVGLIGVAWGGTRIQAWMSRECLMQDSQWREDVARYEEQLFCPELQPQTEIPTVEDWERRAAQLDTGNKGLAAGWAAPEFNDEHWRTIAIPSRWQDHGHPESGVFWFRHSLSIPPEWRGRELKLHLGAIDKHDDTWVNGERVGGLSWEDGPNSWNTKRVYNVPGHLTEHGEQICFAVRARSHIHHGGMLGPTREMYLTLAEDPCANRLPLHGTWRYAVEQDWGITAAPHFGLDKVGDGNPNSLSILFNSRIKPLLPFAIRGVLWYQGESNTSEAKEYSRLLPAMIGDWRRAWGQGDFPFLQVQLANFQMPVAQPCRSDWAELREAQLQALSEPNTGMAVAIDVGDADDIHPRDKRSVGLRLAKWALAKTYGHGGVPSGPLYAGKTMEAGGKVRIHFRYAAGLQTRDGNRPREVSIAGSDKKFVWAESVIENETLVVWHSDISRPLAVRYAWAENPELNNLINGAGLPASPFRTDTW